MSEPSSDAAAQPPAVTAIEALLEEVIAQQEAKVVRIAQELQPGISPEDVLQPHDFEKLRDDAIFNFEDGILTGLRAAQTALRSRVYPALGFRGLARPPVNPGSFPTPDDR